MIVLASLFFCYLFSFFFPCFYVLLANASLLLVPVNFSFGGCFGNWSNGHPISMFWKILSLYSALSKKPTFTRNRSFYLTPVREDTTIILLDFRQKSNFVDGEMRMIKASKLKIYPSTRCFIKNHLALMNSRDRT